jgi:signal transduction histidine kinase/DNA-binding response OmpR family regulator
MKQQGLSTTLSQTTALPSKKSEMLGFMAGGGLMGARIRALNWSETPLGISETWPQSLKTAVHIMLTSRFAMWMAWGSELTFLCNDAYLPTTGLKRDWVLGARSDRIWAEIWSDIGPRIEHVLSTGEATWDEQLLLYLERSGFSEETYHTFSYSPLEDDAGRTSGMLCVVNEVTQRVFAERQLATLRDLGTRLAGASTRAAVMAAFEACVYDNSPDLPFALAYLCEEGNTRPNLLASHGLQRAHPAAVADYWLKNRKALPPLDDSFYAVTELVNQHDSGADWPRGPWQKSPDHAFILSITGGEVSTPLGFFVAGLNPHRAFDQSYRGFIELLTGQIAAAVARADEYERERARAEALSQIDRAKTVFFSNVSHEFRTPLTLMLGPLEDAIADLTNVPTAQADRIKLAHRNAARLLRLVNALLDFSRIEVGRAEASFEPVDIAALTTELASTFRPACDRAGLSLDVDCKAMPEAVYVDRNMWEKIVLNLLSNAFKFTLDGGIAVRLCEKAGNAVIEVADTGIGIPQSELPRLFERFHRVEGSRGRSFEGSGIGLALVQELVRIHGGVLTVESEEAKGTVFRVQMRLGAAHLPADKIRATASTAPVRAEAYVEEALRWLPDSVRDETIFDMEQRSFLPLTRRDARVLLADDNADLRDYVRRLLEAGGYKVEVVPDGAAALEAARIHRPDLLLTDVMMPLMDGLTLLSSIRRDDVLADIPVIMLSARAGEEAQVEGLTRGADDYLVKSFSARELLARVSATIAMARVRQQAAEEVRNANRALALEREFLACVLAKAPIGISIANESGQFLALNERAIELIGKHTAQSHSGRIIYGAVHPDGRPYAPHEYPTLRAARGEIIEGERMICVRGESVTVERIVLEIDAVPIREANGSLVGAVTVFEDAGVCDRAEEELRQRVANAVAEREAALAQLHQVAKLETIGQLTGGVAHDFNNLLTPIIGALDFLRRKTNGDERTTQRITSALQAAERSRTLIQRLLAFARRQSLEARPVDVGGLVEGMCDLTQRTLGVGIRLTFVVAPNLPAATVDPNQLELAILNLCVNSRDAMGENGSLTIAVDEEQTTMGTPPELANGRYIRITVSDTGFGMDDATLKRAIEPFFTTKGHGRGTGLGLSMVDGLAAQSGGAFTLSSERGVGTRASLWLPISEEKAVPIVSNDIVGQPAKASKKVLLVDDEEIVREATADMLFDAGYTVMQAGSAAEALKIARSDNKPDIVVADYKMPGMSGVELSAALKAMNPDLPFLLITGFANLSETDAGGLPRLAKPLREAEIVMRVAKLLDSAPASKPAIRVLVVEDEPIIAKELAYVIEDEAGCALAGIAASVGEALTLIDSERPNGVILDANLNGVSSEKVAEALRRQNTPFFVLSGCISKNLLPAPLNEAPFLHKPYRESELIAQIQALMSRGV